MPPKEENSKSAKDSSSSKATDKKKKDDKVEKKETPPPPPPSPLEVLNRNLSLLDKYVETRDRLFLVRVMRFTNFLRKYCPLSTIRKAVETYVLDNHRKTHLLDSLTLIATVRPDKTTHTQTKTTDDVQMDQGTNGPVKSPPSSTASSSSSSNVTVPSTTPVTTPATIPVVPSTPAHKLPKPGGNSSVEIEAYLHILVLSLLQSVKEILSLRESATQFLEFLSNYNHRTLDFFQGKGWSYLVWSYSNTAYVSSSTTGSSATTSSSSAAASTSEHQPSLASLQPALMTAYRTACLHHDEYGQSVLINLLLFIYIQQKDFETAASLVDRVVFPEAISSAQNVRFLYYTGRIHAVQLRYSDAHNALLQALRKSPPIAVGFRTLVQKFAIIVQMLMGEIPERSTFSQKEMKHSLVPYLAITRAVRSGDVRTFTKVLAESTSVFSKDGTLSLIRRLESNVIRTGLRKIVSSYSRISFSAIATKLGLSSAEDAEYLAAKAIRDGVLDGVLNHEESYLESVSATNVYTSKEPQEAFHRRITFCIDVHDEAVRAMRYPPNVSRADLESAEARRERERGEAELINDIEEGKDDFDDDYDE